MSIDNCKLIRRRRISSPGRDHTLNLPDECLAIIFHSLPYDGRESRSLVCRRWLRIDGQSRHRLNLYARDDLLPSIPSIFTRFDSITELALKWYDQSIPKTTIFDEALILISVKCKNLTRFLLDTCGCRRIIADEVEAFSKNCTRLKMFSCRWCAFGARGLNAVLDNCPELEELYAEGSRITAPITAASSLKVICLTRVENVEFFAPLVGASKSLRSLKLVHCKGESDTLLQFISDSRSEMNEVHLEDVFVSDVGLSAISGFCSNLELLRLVKFDDCTDVGIAMVAKRCNSLRKVEIDDFWKVNQIGGEAVMAMAENCRNLQDLDLNAANPTKLSLEMLAAKCVRLERLSLGEGRTVGDAELLCITGKCNSMKQLWVEFCPVSDECLQALAHGFPNLVEVTFTNCLRLTKKGVNWLRATRPSLTVKFGDPFQRKRNLRRRR